MIIFWGYLIVGFLMVFLYELEFLTPTDIGSDANLVFFMQVLMEFVTIAVIPIALKLFAFKPIRRKLDELKEKALLAWGIARIDMFLCLFFIYPSMGRCYDELGENETNGKM